MNGMKILVALLVVVFMSPAAKPAPKPEPLTELPPPVGVFVCPKGAPGIPFQSKVAEDVEFQALLCGDPASVDANGIPRVFIVVGYRLVRVEKVKGAIEL